MLRMLQEMGGLTNLKILFTLYNLSYKNLMLNYYNQFSHMQQQITIDPMLMQFLKSCYAWPFLSKNDLVQIEILKRIALEQKLYFVIYSSNTNIKLLWLKGMTYPVNQIEKQEPKSLHILKQLAQLFPPMIKADQISWQWSKSRVINQYGSFETQNENIECQICFSRNTNGMQTCCAKSLCSKCDINKEICAFCKQNLLNIGECYKDKNITKQSLVALNEKLENQALSK